VTAAICILARFIWVFPAVYAPRWLSPALRRRDPSPPWTWAFVLSYTGVRGVVSLAAALAIPLTLANGQPFPNRDLILFVAFGVIIVTLVGFGLLMPAVVRWLGVARHRKAEERREAEAELAARHDAMETALREVEERARARGTPDEVLALGRARHEARLQQFPKTMDEGWEAAGLAAKLRMELIAAEREHLYQLLRDGKITDESRRKIERELDLEEAMIACKEEEFPD
jgi:monovalent cation/hydrogen antiporter